MYSLSWTTWLWICVLISHRTSCLSIEDLNSIKCVDSYYLSFVNVLYVLFSFNQPSSFLEHLKNHYNSKILDNSIILKVSFGDLSYFSSACKYCVLVCVFMHVCTIRRLLKEKDFNPNLILLYSIVEFITWSTMVLPLNCLVLTHIYFR